jgi:hypothetical protein
MVLAYTFIPSDAQTMLLSAAALATSLGKELAVCCQTEDNLLPDAHYTFLKAPEKGFEQVAELCEQNDVSFLFIQLPTTKLSALKKMLESCRDLRIPYIFFKDHYPVLNLSKVFLPVNFLEEELEKAQFAAAFGRFCNASVLVLQANDYGSKAATNVAKMKELFDKFSFPVTVEIAKSDSFKVEKEAVQRAENENAGLVIVSASREYGLDDVIFGCKEYHLVRKSTVPLLLVNPRADLYTLCD